jgi:hypothetical protein
MNFTQDVQLVDPEESESEISKAVGSGYPSYDSVGPGERGGGLDFLMTKSPAVTGVSSITAAK